MATFRPTPMHLNYPHELRFSCSQRLSVYLQQQPAIEPYQMMGMSSLIQAARAIISASIVERAVSVYSLDCHITGTPANTITNPDRLLAHSISRVFIPIHSGKVSIRVSINAQLPRRIIINYTMVELTGRTENGTDLGVTVYSAFDTIVHKDVTPA